MRKQLYIALWLFGSFFLESAAQNYRTLPLNVQEHYYKDSLGYVFPIEPDSVKFINGDTIYYHFKTIRASNLTFSGDNYYGQYYNLYGESWAGRKTIINANGDQIWFANHNDSIIIKPLLNKNETWLVSGRHNAWGTVTGISLKTFCGISDSVKTFAVGNSIFELSKNYGFISMPDMFQFYEVLPDDQYGSLELNYPLRGPKGNVNLYGSNLISGTKTKLTDSLTYSYNIGDEIHFKEETQSFFPQIIRTIYTINDKSYNSANRSVNYTIEVCVNSVTGVTTGTYPDYEVVYNSKSAKYETSKTYFFSDSVNTPLKSNFNSGYYNHVVLRFNNNILEQYIDQLYFNSYNDSTLVIDFVAEGDISNIFFENGGDYFSDYELSGSTVKELVYLKNSKTEFGTPYKCDSLIASNTTSFNENIDLTFSNPFSNQLKLEASTQLHSIDLINLQGKIIMHKVVTGNSLNPIIIDTQHFNSGLYLLWVTDQNGNQKAFKVIKE